MKDFINERWRSILAHNGLAGFDDLWKLDAGWFEEPNHRRGGWSGVSRSELKLPEGGTAAIFLKRQENHGTRTLQHPVHGVPTFLREFNRIMGYRRNEIPTLEPVFFGVRGSGKDQRAILATEELSGFVSLEALTQAWLANGRPLRGERERVLLAVADLLSRMHAHGILHSCFYPKHVFVRVPAEGPAEARVIDLEKSRRRPLKVLCALRDLYSLMHYSAPVWSRTDYLRFLLAYLKLSRLTPFAKWLWRKVGARSVTKSKARVSSV